MIRALVSMLVLLSTFAPAAKADDALKNALTLVPSNAMVVASIPNIKGLDADFQSAVKQLELQQMIPFQSLVAFVQQQAPFLAGLNPEGAVTLVIMPAASLQELESKQVLIVPTKDAQAMIESMSGQAGEEGMWTVTMFGQPAQATIFKDHVLLGNSADELKQFEQATETLSTKLSSPELAAMAGMDLVLWVDADHVFTIVKPMIQMFLQSMVAMQASQGELAQKSAEMNQKQLNMLMDGAAAMSMGIGLNDGGVTLRGALKAKPGTELAKQANVKVTADSLLEGLPVDKYVMAFGSIASKAQAEQGMKNLEPFISMLSSVEGIDQDKVTALKGNIEKMMESLSGMRGVIEPLKPGPQGLIGVTLIAQTTDSTMYLDESKKAFDLAKEMVNSAGDKVDDKVKSIIDALTWERQAEEIGGVKVDVMKLDLAKIDAVDEDELAEFHKVIGKDGITFRMAPASGTTVVVVFGGGTDRFAQALEQAQSSAAPLAQDSGIKKVTPYLPKEHSQVFYLAFDHGLSLVQNILRAIDEEPLPFPTPAVNAPLAMVTTGGDGWVEFDMLLPMDLIIAGKNVGMAMMGGQPPAAAPPATQPAP